METYPSHMQLWLALFAAAGFVYTAGLVVYRLFLHPLAKYPGPLLAKLTDAYMLYHAWKGERHLEFWRLHERYGRVVRFGPSSLSVNSATALRDIYGFRANVRKAEFYDAFVHPAPNTHNVRDKDVHALKRRVMSQAFSEAAIKEMERYILGNVRTFCDVVGDLGRMGGGGSGGGDEKDSGWTAPKNMADLFSWMAMDILGDLCFGKAFNMLERPDNRYAIALVGVASQRHLICGTMPIVNKLSLDKILFRKIAAGRARFMAYSRAQLAERTKLGDETDRRDFFYHLLKARDPETGQGFSMPELWGESNLLLIAGSDTTSTALAATLFYLVRNPAALTMATAEVRGRFMSVEDIHQGPGLSSLTYVRACIDESMRLSPSVGGLLPREVLPGGLVVDGESIPAGTVVGTPHYALHHNPSHFRAPFSFVPERWIVGAKASADSTTEQEVVSAQAAFCPFSIGPRGCIGKALAYVEMMTAMARLLYLYDVRRGGTPASASDVYDRTGEGGSEGAVWGRHRRDEYQLVDTFTSLKNGPMVEFRRREAK